MEFESVLPSGSISLIIMCAVLLSNMDFEHYVNHHSVCDLSSLDCWLSVVVNECGKVGEDIALKSPLTKVADWWSMVQ